MTTVPGKVVRKPEIIKDVAMNSVLINCRSLKQKLNSLSTNFEMNKSMVALLTETWFTRNDKILKNRLNDFELEKNIAVIRRDRNSRGGGVALAFDGSKSNFKKIPLKSLVKCPFEILAAGGNCLKIKNTTSFSLATYLQTIAL